MSLKVQLPRITKTQFSHLHIVWWISSYLLVYINQIYTCVQPIYKDVDISNVSEGHVITPNIRKCCGSFLAPMLRSCYLISLELHNGIFHRYAVTLPLPFGGQTATPPSSVLPCYWLLLRGWGLTSFECSNHEERWRG